MGICCALFASSYWCHILSFRQSLGVEGTLYLSVGAACFLPRVGFLPGIICTFSMYNIFIDHHWKMNDIIILPMDVCLRRD